MPEDLSSRPRTLEKAGNRAGGVTYQLRQLATLVENLNLVPALGMESEL